MALDKASLETNIGSRINDITLGGDTNAADEIAKVIAEEVHTYLEVFVSTFNSHTHSGVITLVAGGSGAPATGTTGDTGSPNATV